MNTANLLAQISQLFPYFGGKITDEEWDNSLTDKFVIIRIGLDIIKGCYNRYYHFLSFHTREQSDEFLKYNERLVRDYLMLD